MTGQNPIALVLVKGGWAKRALARNLRAIARGVGIILVTSQAGEFASRAAGIDSRVSPAPIAASASPVEIAFAKDVRPFFSQYCFECHGNKKTKARINLERMTASPNFAGLFKDWQRIAAILEQKEMPPEEEAQPSVAERKKLITLVRGGLDRFIKDTAGDPGRVVMRKLTSAEYAYTIQDLTGLDLELEKHFDIDPAGGEGFSNVGDVQFIQDSTLERYLEAARTVASRAVIGAGPLQFYRDPGQTGQELSAINRIRRIYEQHGVRTGAGEGAVAFGLDRYPKAFFVAWRFQHRRELGLRNATLAKLAQEDGLDAPFAEHIWSVLNDPSLTFAAADIVAAWRKLPAPTGRDPKSQQSVRAQCDDLYELLRNWQAAFSANSGSDEEVPLLSETSFRPTLKHTFRALVNWPRGATNASFEIVAMPAGGAAGKQPVVLWQQPSVRFRQAGARGQGVGGGGRGRGGGTPLKRVVSEASAQLLKFGQGLEGAAIGTNDFVTVGSVTLLIEFPVPAGAIGADVSVDVQLDLEHGGDALVRSAISSQVIEGQGQTAAASGVVSALLANPDSPQLATWKAGAVELSRTLPQVTHREAAPSDRDAIPPPWDNTYNTAERNEFHYVIKYHRDDRFLTERVLDDATRAQLDAAWADLLTSFPYHDTYLRFVAKKYKLDLGDRTVATLSPEWINQQPEEPRGFIKRLHDEHTSMQRALQDAQPGHVEDALRFARLAWRRPLTEREQSRLRSFYAGMREGAKLEHADAIRALLARVLVAPAFLYRVESPGVSSAGKDAVERVPARVPLSDWELASRLSYFLWSSIPDAELSRAAAAGELRKPDQLARQAQRMLRDPKARRFATEFFGQWFGFYRFEEYRGVDTTRFTEFTDSLKAAMHDEAVSFFEHIVREDRPVQDVVFADYSFLNRNLADHYGIDSPAVPTNGIARVGGVNQFHRGGLLQLGAVLTATSAPLRTSAVKRGDWILRRVLGTPVPPPPGDAGSIPPDDVLSDGKTVRQRLEAHRTDASCVNCHSRIDPLGFALEHFDSIGRWRDHYRDGQAIDSNGTLNDGTEISGLDGLYQYLRSQEPAFRRNLSAKLLGYALGRSEMVSDRPLIDQMTAGLKKDSRFSTLVTQIVSSPQFRYQRAREADAQPIARTAAVTQPGRSTLDTP